MEEKAENSETQGSPILHHIGMAESYLSVPGYDLESLLRGLTHAVLAVAEAQSLTANARTTDRMKRRQQIEQEKMSEMAQMVVERMAEKGIVEVGDLVGEQFVISSSSGGQPVATGLVGDKTVSQTAPGIQYVGVDCDLGHYNLDEVKTTGKTTMQKIPGQAEVQVSGSVYYSEKTEWTWRELRDAGLPYIQLQCQKHRVHPPDPYSLCTCEWIDQ